MSLNEKPGGGGEMQPYVPAGNGDKSGEYTNASYESFDHYTRRGLAKSLRKEFITNNHCSAKELEAKLSKEEINAVVLYSDFEVGRALNKNIRNNTMSEEDNVMCKNIENAIQKHRLYEDVRVYRGITVPRKVYEEKFWSAYVNDKVISGSRICSTSRNMFRAFVGTISKNKDDVGIIFSCELKRGDSALPIEDIAKTSGEEEILLSNPMYYISDIKKAKVNGKEIIKIDIILVR